MKSIDQIAKIKDYENFVYQHSSILYYWKNKNGSRIIDPLLVIITKITPGSSK